MAAAVERAVSSSLLSSSRIVAARFGLCGAPKVAKGGDDVGLGDGRELDRGWRVDRRERFGHQREGYRHQETITDPVGVWHRAHSGRPSLTYESDIRQSRARSPPGLGSTFARCGRPPTAFLVCRAIEE